jgi:hypothetical protein
MDDDRYRTRRGEDDIYARIVFSGGMHWYWATRRTGDAYQLVSVAPGGDSDKLVIELIMREFIAGLLHVARLSKALSIPDDSELLLQARLRNIKDRLLIGNNPGRAFSFHLAMWSHRSSDAEVVSTARLRASSLRDDLRNVVEMLFGDLMGYFNFLVVPSDYYDYAVDAMMERE